MDVPCFFVEPTGDAQIFLRRYRSSLETCELSGYGYHNAETLIDEAPLVYDENGYQQPYSVPIPGDDPRWPVRCACGYEFQASDPYQVNQQKIYTRKDTGERMPGPLHRMPAGAMWHADWYTPEIVGPDGHCLVVMTPGGEWIIDSRASNCTRPHDTVHKCWVRHGSGPEITVDKAGDTCSAGAGSILCGSYHGFLRGGILQSC